MNPTLKKAALALAGVVAATTLTLDHKPRAAERTSDVEAVSPALSKYDAGRVQALWNDQRLSARDRSLATITVLVANGQSGELGFYVDKALNDGLTAGEISETITHLAFYSGWQNAMEAVPVVAEVFKKRRIDADQLPPADPELLPQDEAAEAARAANVQRQYGQVSQGVVDDTTDVLFNDLWLRPGLKPRDRSLVTVVAVIATAQPNQIPFHLGRAMDNGLTDPEVDAVLHHVIYFTGWPKVFTAMPVVRDVLAERS